MQQSFTTGEQMQGERWQKTVERLQQALV